MSSVETSGAREVDVVTLTRGESDVVSEVTLVTRGCNAVEREGSDSIDESEGVDGED